MVGIAFWRPLIHLAGIAAIFSLPPIVNIERWIGEDVIKFEVWELIAGKGVGRFQAQGRLMIGGVVAQASPRPFPSSSAASH